MNPVIKFGNTPTLIDSDGEVWKKLRHAISPTFSARKLKMVNTCLLYETRVCHCMSSSTSTFGLPCTNMSTTCTHRPPVQRPHVCTNRPSVHKAAYTERTLYTDNLYRKNTFTRFLFVQVCTGERLLVHRHHLNRETI